MMIDVMLLNNMSEVKYSARGTEALSDEDDDEPTLTTQHAGQSKQ